MSEKSQRSRAFYRGRNGRFFGSSTSGISEPVDVVEAAEALQDGGDGYPDQEVIPGRVVVSAPTPPSPADQWSPQQTIFIDWLATPAPLRAPPTLGGLADALGCNRLTLHRWRAMDGFADAVVARARSVLKSADVATILHGQARQAIAGDTTAARFVFEVLGIIAAKGAPSVSVAVNNNTLSLDGLSADETRALLSYAAKEVQR